MNILENKHDCIESLIYNDCIAIQNIDFHKELDLMLIVLNSKAVLQQKISHHTLLAKATEEQLINYELIANGIGVHWPDINEDLSLKGFLQDEIKRVVNNDVIAAQVK